MKNKKLYIKVTCSYEPSRLEKMYLSAAYEKLEPILKQPTSVSEKSNEHKKEIQRRVKW